MAGDEKMYAERVVALLQERAARVAAFKEVGTPAKRRRGWPHAADLSAFGSAYASRRRRTRSGSLRLCLACSERNACRMLAGNGNALSRHRLAQSMVSPSHHVQSISR